MTILSKTVPSGSTAGEATRSTALGRASPR